MSMNVTVFQGPVKDTFHKGFLFLNKELVYKTVRMSLLSFVALSQ